MLYQIIWDVPCTVVSSLTVDGDVKTPVAEAEDKVGKWPLRPEIFEPRDCINWGCSILISGAPDPCTEWVSRLPMCCCIEGGGCQQRSGLVGGGCWNSVVLFSCDIGQTYQPILTFGLGVRPKPRKWSRLYTSSQPVSKNYLNHLGSRIYPLM